MEVKLMNSYWFQHTVANGVIVANAKTEDRKKMLNIQDQVPQGNV